MKTEDFFGKLFNTCLKTDCCLLCVCVCVCVSSFAVAVLHMHSYIFLTLTRPHSLFIQCLSQTEGVSSVWWPSQDGVQPENSHEWSLRSTEAKAVMKCSPGPLTSLLGVIEGLTETLLTTPTHTHQWCWPWPEVELTFNQRGQRNAAFQPASSLNVPCKVLDN